MFVNRFEKNLENYSKNAFIQKKITSVLIDILKNKIGYNFKNIFEIGCGCGFLTNEIYKNIEYNKLFLNDLYDIDLICNKFYLGNIEDIELPKGLDLIISSSVFQWIKNLDIFIKKIFNSLVNGGYLVFSMFIDKNYYEIKDIFDVGLNYYNTEELKLIFKKYFKILYYDDVLETVSFNNLIDILKHIKNTGVNSIKEFYFNKSSLIKYINKYNEKYNNNLTYNYNYVILRKI